MDAISLSEGYSAVDKKRCIGCGLCISSCPVDALKLVRKPQKEQMEIPKTNIEKYIQLGRERGKLGAGKIAVLQLKSKFDRLRAAVK